MSTKPRPRKRTGFPAGGDRYGDVRRSLMTRGAPAAGVIRRNRHPPAGIVTLDATVVSTIAVVSDEIGSITLSTPSWMEKPVRAYPSLLTRTSTGGTAGRPLSEKRPLTSVTTCTPVVRRLTSAPSTGTPFSSTTRPVRVTGATSGGIASVAHTNHRSERVFAPAAVILAVNGRLAAASSLKKSPLSAGELGSARYRVCGSGSAVSTGAVAGSCDW